MVVFICYCYVEVQTDFRDTVITANTKVCGIQSLSLSTHIPEIVHDKREKGGGVRHPMSYNYSVFHFGHPDKRGGLRVYDQIEMSSTQYCQLS